MLATKSVGLHAPLMAGFSRVADGAVSLLKSFTGRTVMEEIDFMQISRPHANRTHSHTKHNQNHISKVPAQRPDLSTRTGRRRQRTRGNGQPQCRSRCMRGRRRHVRALEAEINEDGRVAGMRVIRNSLTVHEIFRPHCAHQRFVNDFNNSLKFRIP